MTELDHPIHLLSILHPSSARSLSFQISHKEHMSQSPQILEFHISKFDGVAGSDVSEGSSALNDSCQANELSWPPSPSFSSGTNRSINFSPHEIKNNFRPSLALPVSKSKSGSSGLDETMQDNIHYRHIRDLSSSSKHSTTSSTTNILLSPLDPNAFASSPCLSNDSSHITSSTACDLWNSHESGGSGLFPQWSEVPTPTSSVIARRFSGLANFGIGDAASEVARMLQETIQSPRTDLQHQRSFLLDSSSPNSSASMKKIFISASSSMPTHPSPATNSASSSSSISLDHPLSSSDCGYYDCFRSNLLGDPSRKKSFSSISSRGSRTKSSEPSSPFVGSAAPSAQRCNISPCSSYSSKFRPQSWGSESRESYGEVMLISCSRLSSISCDDDSISRNNYSTTGPFSLGFGDDAPLLQSLEDYFDPQSDSQEFGLEKTTLNCPQAPDSDLPENFYEKRLRSFADHVRTVSMDAVKTSSTSRFPPPPLILRPNPKSASCVVNPEDKLLEKISPTSKLRRPFSFNSGKLSMPSLKKSNSLIIDFALQNTCGRTDLRASSLQGNDFESPLAGFILPRHLCLSPKLDFESPALISSPIEKIAVESPTCLSDKTQRDLEPSMTRATSSEESSVATNFNFERANCTIAVNNHDKKIYLNSKGSTLDSSRKTLNSRQANFDILDHKQSAITDDSLGYLERRRAQTIDQSISRCSQEFLPLSTLTQRCETDDLYRNMPALDDQIVEPSNLKSNRKSFLNILKSAVSASSSPAPSPHGSPSGATARLAKRRPPAPSNRVSEQGLSVQGSFSEDTAEKNRAPQMRRARSQSSSGSLSHKISRSIALPISDSHLLKPKNKLSTNFLGLKESEKNNEKSLSRSLSKTSGRPTSHRNSEIFKKKKLSKSKTINASDSLYNEEVEDKVETVIGILNICDDMKFVKALEILHRKRSQAEKECFQAGFCDQKFDDEDGSNDNKVNIYVDSAEWKKEVRDMLIVREIVASEKSYMGHLSSLLEAVEGLDGGSGLKLGFSRAMSLQRSSILGPSLGWQGSVIRSSSASPQVCQNAVVLSSVEPFSPPGVERGPRELLLRHLPRLIAISNKILRDIEKSPSVIGVAQSFLAVEEEMKRAYGKWCSVVDTIQKEIRQGNNLTLRTEWDIKSSSGYNKLSGGLRRSLSSGKIQQGSIKLSMSDVVIMPVQRITRYHLFMKEILKQSSTINGLQNASETQNSILQDEHNRGSSIESQNENALWTIEKAFRCCKSVAEHCNQMRTV
ncbi:hypothetical protein BY996DRAFT_6420048 [Phakopsora pachyrhizi]|uniref:Expressed protein n=1 Tax=Phakopsora pachyrhizi TaxID=170000 RepID=A0AAV0B4K4_PHAPC|nr:hypothetical protein BY996DRAFT_6420048 [Phakopsora pachyrhizi]CAH7681633.1 expressed protein [Phakopsora pachyrhizi]